MAYAMIFGLAVSTVLTLVVIPVIYFAAFAEPKPCRMSLRMQMHNTLKTKDFRRLSMRTDVLETDVTVLLDLADRRPFLHSLPPKR